jgi:quercetin dioxygenase-like cupin family protein
MMPNLETVKNLPTREVFPGFHGRFVHSTNMTFAYWDIDQGSLVPEHSHMHEQVVNMLEGTLELTVDGHRQVLGPGQVLVIPSHAIHSGRALTPCKVLDVFSPVREDYR